MPRGARGAHKCTLSILEPQAPKINLFKIRRTKGWWPFQTFDEALGQHTLRVRYRYIIIYSFLYRVCNDELTVEVTLKLMDA